MGEKRLEFAPERDSLKQRAGVVEARQSERQRCVEMKVAIDERGSEQVTARVDRLSRLGLDSGFDGDDAAVALPAPDRPRGRREAEDGLRLSPNNFTGGKRADCNEPTRKRLPLHLEDGRGLATRGAS